MQAGYASDDALEAVWWRARERRLAPADISGFFDASLERFAVFHYRTSTFETPPHPGHLSFRLLVSGGERYDLGARRAALGAGEAMFLNHGQSYSSAIIDTDTECLSVFIPEPEASGALAAIMFDEALLLDGPDRDVRRALPQTPSRAPEALRDAARSLIGAMAGECLECVHERTQLLLLKAAEFALAQTPLQPFTKVERRAVRDELMTRLLRARDHIEDAGGRDCALDRLASLACMSRYHFLRRFAEAFGVTPAAYARRLRLSAARAALARGADIAAAARLAGYSATAPFRRAWRKEFGADPPR